MEGRLGVKRMFLEVRLGDVRVERRGIVGRTEMFLRKRAKGSGRGEDPESRVQGKDTENDAGSSSSAQDLVFNHSGLIP